MVVPATASAALVTLGAEVVNLAVREGWLERLAHALRRRHRVLVVGSTGTGKSNLLSSLIDVLPSAIDAMNRTEFVARRKLSIERTPFDFIDTPGQYEHRPRRIDAIREAMKGPLAGIINVVCYGYHEHKTGAGSAFEPDTDRVRSEYLQAHRAIEIEQLAEWTGLLGDRRTTGWLMTVVTKADLWWDSQHAVRDFYRRGEYAAALQPVAELAPVTLEHCSVFHRFYGRGTLSGKLDDSDRLKMRSNLLTSILAGMAEFAERGSR